MTELEKIAYAKQFLDKLAEGVNPVDGTPVPEGDVAAQKRVVGCFRFVSDLLGNAIRAGGMKTAARTVREPFSATPEQLMKYRFPPEPRTMNRFVQAVNDTVDLSRVRSLRVRDVMEWLTREGILGEETLPDGRRRKVPTEKGREIGLVSSEKNGHNGAYLTIAYDRAAQTYMLDHMASIAACALELEEERRAEPKENGPAGSEADEAAVPSEE